MKKYTDEEILEKVRQLRNLLSSFSFLAQEWCLIPLFEIGPALFNLWKKIVNLSAYDDFLFPEPIPLTVFLFIESIDSLREKYKEELIRHTEEDFQLLRHVYMDITYCTSSEILKKKYPEVPEEYLESRAEMNLENLGKCIEAVKQKNDRTDLDPGPKGELHAFLNFFKDCLPYLDFLKDEDKEKYKKILELIEQLGGE